MRSTETHFDGTHINAVPQLVFTAVLREQKGGNITVSGQLFSFPSMKRSAEARPAGGHLGVAVMYSRNKIYISLVSALPLLREIFAEITVVLRILYCHSQHVRAIVPSPKRSSAVAFDKYNLPEALLSFFVHF